MSEKLDREELLANEDELLRGLLEAAEYPKEETEIEIARKGKVLFRFRVRPLTEAEINECRELATKYVRNKAGIPVREKFNLPRFRSLLIYRATVEEDRKRLWDNKVAWEKLNVVSGIDLIDAVLLPGEKTAVVDKIGEISGYVENEEELEEELEEIAKN